MLFSLAALLLAVKACEASIASDVLTTQNVHAVDAHTVFEGRKVGLRFENPLVRNRVSLLHRASLLGTFYSDLSVETHASFKDDPKSLVLARYGDVFRAFPEEGGGRFKYLSWYPRVFMKDQPTQMVSFESSKRDRIIAFTNSQEANTFRSYRQLIHETKKWFPKDIALDGKPKQRLVNVFFDNGGKPTLFPGFLWKLEWTVKLYFLTLISGGEVDDFHGFTSLMFPGSSIAPLINDQLSSCEVFKNSKLMQRVCKSDAFALGIKRLDRLQLIDRGTNDAQLIRPFIPILASNEGILIAFSPSRIIELASVIGYVLQISNEPSNVKPAWIKMAISMPEGCKTHSLKDLYDAIVAAIMKPFDFQLWSACVDSHGKAGWSK